MGFFDKAAGALPYVGPIYHGAKAIYHGGAAAIDYATGDEEHAEDNATHAMVEAVEAVPGLGTAVSAGEFIYDGTEGDKPSEEYLYGEDDDATESMREELREKLFGERQNFDDSCGPKIGETFDLIQEAF